MAKSNQKKRTVKVEAVGQAHIQALSTISLFL